jgi:rubrerythrin/DNA-directed RNA polymerase subunit RPC12/RpoP
MGSDEKEVFFCEHCGAEADMTIEGVETVADVVRRDKSHLCHACGKETVLRSDRDGLSCKQCGAEADMTLEGFEQVEDVIKRKKRVACKACGQDLPWTGREAVIAVQVAMEAEKRACEFYGNAAKKIKNPRGREMFEQLSEFEMNHFKKLKELAGSLREKGEWVSYGGTSFPKKGAPWKGEKPKVREDLTDLEALKIAVREEKKAESYYRSMAELTTDPRGKEMYKHLAEEEALHEKLLNDQFYSLQNTGFWSWGD